MCVWVDFQEEEPRRQQVTKMILSFFNWKCKGHTTDSALPLPHHHGPKHSSQDEGRERFRLIDFGRYANTQAYLSDSHPVQSVRCEERGPSYASLTPQGFVVLATTDRPSEELEREGRDFCKEPPTSRWAAFLTHATCYTFWQGPHNNCIQLKFLLLLNHTHTRVWKEGR